MPDTLSAPASDRCAFPVGNGVCGLPESASHGSHTFVRPGQVRYKEPVDPFRTIRKMTAEEKAAAVETERTFVATAMTPLKREQTVVVEKHSEVRAAAGKIGGKAKLSPDERRVIAKNAAEKRWARQREATGVAARVHDPHLCNECGKPKLSHRGSIGHSFNNERAILQLKDKPPCVHCGKSPLSHRGHNAKKLGHRYEAARGETIAIPDVRGMAMREEGVDLGPLPVKSRATTARDVEIRELANLAPVRDAEKAAMEDWSKPWPSADKEAPPPITVAMIAESITRAIATIDGSILRELRLKVGVGVDRQILTAEAVVCLSMTFANQSQQEEKANV